MTLPTKLQAHFKSLLLLALILFALGCSSTLKRAHTLYEHGSYDEAMTLYQKVLAGNPENDEAIIGLRKARLKWIDHKLVETRLLRLGGNTQQSLDTLNDILHAESKWGIFPTGAVAFTQEEESEYAARAIRDQIIKSLQAQRPLLASVVYKEYRGFFQASRASTGDKLNTMILTHGKTACQELKNGLNPHDYYLALFTEKFCQYFGDNSIELKKHLAGKNKNLFKNIKFSFAHQNLDSLSVQQIQDSLTRGFQSTAWYDAHGKKDLQVDGALTLSREHTMKPATLTHSYSVEIPYEVEWKEDKKEERTKSTLVAALDATVAVASLFSGHSSDRREYDNGDGTVTVHETRYRDEPRTMTYTAKIHNQDFRFTLKGNALLADMPISLLIDESYNHQTVEHHNDMPKVDLKPRKPELISEADWLRTHLPALTTQFKEKANQAWREKNCKASEEGALATVSPEQVFRCLRAGIGVFPLNYDNWFKQRFGVSAVDAIGLLGEI